MLEPSFNKTNALRLKKERDKEVGSFYQFVDHVGDGASVLSVEGGVDLVEKVERGRVAFLQTAWQ